MLEINIIDSIMNINYKISISIIFNLESWHHFSFYIIDMFICFFKHQ